MQNNLLYNDRKETEGCTVSKKQQSIKFIRGLCAKFGNDWMKFVVLENCFGRNKYSRTPCSSSSREIWMLCNVSSQQLLLRLECHTVKLRRSCWLETLHSLKRCADIFVSTLLDFFLIQHPLCLMTGMCVCLILIIIIIFCFAVIHNFEPVLLDSSWSKESRWKIICFFRQRMPKTAFFFFPLWKRLHISVISTKIQSIQSSSFLALGLNLYKNLLK